MLRRLAAWCYRHRWRVVVSWIILLVGVNVLAQTVGGDLLKTFSLPGSESQRAFDTLGRDFARKGDTGDLVFKVRGAGAVTEPQVKAAIDPVIATLRKQPHVVSVSSPYDPANSRFVSSGGKIAYAEILFDVQANDVPINLATHMRGIVSKASTPALQVELAGSMFTDQTQPASEAIGILAAILILLLAFGSLLAMGLPIMTAMFGIGIGLATVTLLARVLDIPSFAPQVTAMIGIGVGIDYALFISTRFREALHEGADPERAVVHAIDTSGRAVLFAGGTVVISLLGLFVIGVSFIRGLAIGASLAVLFVMAAAVTLLPAVLGFVGHTIDKFALPGAKRRRSVEGSFWARWSRTLQARPWTAAIAGLVILLVLAVPFFSLRLGVADAGNDPTKLTTRRAYDLLSRGFGPGFNGPLLIVAQHVENPADTQQMAAALTKMPDVAQVTPVVAQNGISLIRVTPKSGPNDPATAALVHTLRNDRAAIEGRTGAHILVGGTTASNIDVSAKLPSALPIFLLVVVGLAFLLLTFAFRTILVPIKSILGFLLLMAGALGAQVAMFQWGWGQHIFGITPSETVSFLPIIMLAIIFGLSSDYEVFVVSRIKEEFTKYGDARRTVQRGAGVSARVVTAAALIMFSIFVSFMLTNDPTIKAIGFSFATGVFLDAFVVRLTLVPAVMSIIGSKRWYPPRWFAKYVPDPDIEGQRLEHKPAEGELVAAGTSARTGQWTP